MSNHNIHMAQTVGNNRGLCSRCEHFAARRFENGDQRFVCRAESTLVPVHGIVSECTDYKPKGPGVYGSMAWSIVQNHETGKLRFRDDDYTFWEVERTPRGRFKRIKRVKDKE